MTTRPWASYYSRIEAVDYYRCSYQPHGDFVEEINNMCRSFVDHVFEVEDRFGPFDVVHAHDWLAANAMIWIKQGRSRNAVITIHSTEYGRCGNQFFSGPSERVRMQEHAGIKWADRVIAVSSATSRECQWMYSTAEEKITLVSLADYGLNVKPPKSVPVHAPNPNFTGHPINTSPGFSESLFYAFADHAVKRDPPPRGTDPPTRHHA